jgi:hypothetical protein
LPLCPRSFPPPSFQLLSSCFCLSRAQ